MACWIVNTRSTTDHKRNRNKAVYYSQVLEEAPGMPPGSTQGGEVKIEFTQGERQYLWYTPLLGSVGRVFWGSWAEARLVNSNRKSRVLASLMGTLPKGGA